MSTDQKKSLVKMYLVLSVFCLFVIVALYFVELYWIIPNNSTSPTQFVWFPYLNNIIYGIFTGVLTGLGISFYEYRQQIYIDLYTYIKNTRECVTVIRRMLVYRNYDLCLFQIEQYNDDTKDAFAIRKLSKRNRQIYDSIEAIKQNMSDVSNSITTIHNESGSLNMLHAKINGLGDSVFAIDSIDMADDNLRAKLKEIKDQKVKIEKKIGMKEEYIKILVDECTKKLDKIEKLYTNLYEHINKVRRIFFL